MDNDTIDTRLEISESNKQLIQEVFELELAGHKDARDLYTEELAGFLIKTDDGSYTLSSAIRGSESETLHSTFGARTEAFNKFAIPSKLKETAQTTSIIRVLDLCSGIGYNCSAILDYLNDIDIKIEIDMVESSIETLATTLFVPDICKSHEYVKKTIETYLIEHEYLQYNKVISDIPSNITLNLHVCDAREFIKNHANKEYDAVFLDPFSPSKSPELFTVDFFNKLKEFITPHALILTYTAASPVRSAMVNAGLEVGEGPRFHRSGGTVASRSTQLIDKPLSFSDEKLIALSDVGVPFMDHDLEDDFTTIVERRQSLRDKVRGVVKFPSSSKLPRYLGLDPEEIEDVNLREKLTGYVQQMGFESLVDPRIMEVLDIDQTKPSRDQIIQLEGNLRKLLE
ncbi:MAG: hypothetical protein LUG89_03115 [Methanosphaera sp.]|nr:hypothetical protein [Methanosphaera sp.]